MPLVVGRDRASLAIQMTTYTVPAYRRVLDESGLREEADAILAALAERRRSDAARIIDDHCLDQLGVAELDDLAEALHRWSAYADVIGLTVPWYGLDRAAQLALFRDVLEALRRM
jgi:transposase